jgi:hypothetical protein
MELDRRQELRTTKRVLEIVLLVAVGLLLPFPLIGALLMVVAGFGFAIVWETELGEPVMTPVRIEDQP